MNKLTQVLDARNEALSAIATLTQCQAECGAIVSSENLDNDGVLAMSAQQMHRSMLNHILTTLGEPKVGSEELSQKTQETVDRLKGLMPALNNEGRADCKKLKDMVEDYDETYLDDGWMDKKSVDYDEVELGELSAAFARDNKIVEGVISDIRDEVNAYGEKFKELNQLTDDWVKYVSDTLSEILDGEPDQAVSAAKSLVDSLPEWPRDKWSGTKYHWLGANSENMPLDGGEYQATKMPALGRDGVSQAAQYAQDLTDVHCDYVERALQIPSEELMEKASSVKDLLKEDSEAQDKFSSVFDQSVLQTILGGPYAKIANLAEVLAMAIDEYLDASVEDKDTDGEEEED